MQTINCRGRLLDLGKPVIMGILNLTPDSFYDGGRYNKNEEAIIRAGKMIADGASIIDVGGMSSRPGSRELPEQEEIDRIIPVIAALRQADKQVFLSVDTYRLAVARAAVEAGADLINDISAGELDPEIITFAASHQIPCILMHMAGLPENMQHNPSYEDVVQYVLQYLLRRIKVYEDKGLKELIIDPGFGFGKTLEHNYQLLNRLEVFKILGKPVLAGLSRKSMIYKITGGTPETALAGTTAAQMVALQKGASILRVHDVQEARDTIRIWAQIKQVAR